MDHFLKPKTIAREFGKEKPCRTRRPNALLIRNQSYSDIGRTQANALATFGHVFRNLMHTYVLVVPHKAVAQISRIAYLPFACFRELSRAELQSLF